MFQILIKGFSVRPNQGCCRYSSGRPIVSLLCLTPLLLSCAYDLARLPASDFELADTHLSSHLTPERNDSFHAAELAAKPGSGILASTERTLLDSSNELALAAEPAGRASPEQNVSLFNIDAVEAPIDALLFSLASDAGLNLQINGQLSKTVTLRAEQQSLAQLLDSLARQVMFSWQQDKQTLLVWSGVAYGFSYPVNYLNMSRSTRSRVGLATQVGTINAADDGLGSVANSSQTIVENLSEHGFWDSLEADVAGLMVADDAMGKNAGGSQGNTQYSINREAGLLTVFAHPSVHRSIQRYLRLLNNSSQRQVLIEATVVEVALSESFEAGVDWQVLANGINGVSAAQILAGAPLVNAQNISRLSAPAGLLSLVQQSGGQNIQATLSLLEQFGDVRILSRPRIIAMNNQSSILKVVDNRVYFTVNVQRRQNEISDEIETETEIHTVPVGLVMNVTPQISEHGSVMLNVRPTLSRILGFVNDPNPQLAQANVRNGVPEIQVREMETMLRVQSGRVAVIGGLMQETSSDNDSQIPGLARLAGIGNLFKNKSRRRQQTELLIVLRPTVIDSAAREYVHE